MNVFDDLCWVFVRLEDLLPYFIGCRESRNQRDSLMEQFSAGKVYTKADFGKNTLLINF